MRALHAQVYGEAMNAAMLIPHMLQAFMDRDRGFRRGGQELAVMHCASRNSIPADHGPGQSHACFGKAFCLTLANAAHGGCGLQLSRACTELTLLPEVNRLA